MVVNFFSREKAEGKERKGAPKGATKVKKNKCFPTDDIFNQHNGEDSQFHSVSKLLKKSHFTHFTIL